MSSQPEEQRTAGEPSPPEGEQHPARAVMTSPTADGSDVSEPSEPVEPTDATEPVEPTDEQLLDVDAPTPVPPADVEVLEPPIPVRVRRPADVVRLVIAVLLLVLGLVLADIASGTRGAVEQDLTEATSGLPRVLLTLLAWLSGIGVLLLPIGVGIDLVVRRRGLQLIQALGAAVVSGILVIVLAVLVQTGNGGFLTEVLTRSTSTGHTGPLDIVIVTTVSLLTVADISGRKWLWPIAVTVVIATLVTTLLSGAMTLAALAASLLIGWLVGLVFRLAFGVTTTRAPGREVADVLVATGLPLSRLELVDANDAGDRRYAATSDSRTLDVHVVDRDTFGLASGRRFLRVLRLRSGFTRAPALTLRSELEHRTLMGLVLEDLGIAAPRPVSVAEVGAFSAVIAYVEPEGTPLAEIGDALTDAQLAAVFRLSETLHRRRVAHRALSPQNVLVDGDRVALARLGSGDVAADDISLRIDLAQLLTTVALAVGPERAARAAIDTLGEDAVLRAVPLLQSVAMTPDTREALREHRGVLKDLRGRLVELRPSIEHVEPVQLRRVSARAVITVIGGGIAAYVILTQLTEFDLATIFRQADWRWMVALVAAAALTFAGASIALAGASPIHLRFVRTYMTQLAVAFSGLVAPAAVGNIALNTRYLQTSGLTPTLAGASVGVAQVAQFCSYFVLLVLSGVLAGTGPSVSFSPSPVLVAVILAVVIAALGLLAVPRIRTLLTERVLPQVRSAMPQVLETFQHPRRLVRLLGGALLLDMSFVAALVFATRAFGVEPSVASVAVVYFAGAIVGSAVPTPGGLGGIEAAMSFGLTAIGVDSAVAVPAVILYRLATYWLPIPFGWFSLNRLQKVGAL